VRLELKASLAGVLDGSADAVYPFLASLLGLALEGADAERLNGLSRDSVQRQTFEAVATLFETLAHEEPLCLVFEDLHWADESTLQLLEDLLDLADREAAVLVLLYRSERDHAAWHLGEVARQRFPHRQVELELRALAPEDSALLAVGAAGAELPTEVSDLLALRSGGNPFFLEEALRDLVELGVLHPVNAHWELTIAAEELTVPLLVQETLQARLDRLAPATREAASVAAAIGARFGLPLLERLTDAMSLQRRCRSCNDSTSSSRSAGDRPGSTASVTGWCKRSRTAHSRRHGGGSCTAPPERRSRSCGGTRSRRSTSRSPVISPRRAYTTRPSSTCSLPATPPGASTPIGPHLRTTVARSSS
jgi:hypothetical protein